MLFLVAELSKPGYLRLLDYFGYDALLQALPPPEPSRTITMVDLDEASLKELGQWPWPRFRIARLLESLRRAEVRAVALDFLFAEPDRLSIQALEEAWRQEFHSTVDSSQIPAEYRDNDVILAKEVSKGPVALGVWFSFEGLSGPPSGGISRADVVLRGPDLDVDQLPVAEAVGLVPLVPVLAESAPGIGFLNSLPDADGRIRRAQLLVRYKGHFYPSLVLETLLQAHATDRLTVEYNAAGLERVTFDDVTITTDPGGRVLLPFSSSDLRRFPSVSVADVLAGRYHPEDLKDRIVIVGSSAAALSDFHATPTHRNLPGFFVHAIAADAILEGTTRFVPPWATAVEVVMVLVTGLIVTFVFSRFRMVPCVAIALTLLVLFWAGSYVILSESRMYLSPVTSTLTLLFGALILGFVRLRSEERRALRHARERIEAQDCAMLGLVSITETRDPETGYHILRTQHYVRVLAEHLSANPRFRQELTPENIEAIFKSAPLHDIGKVGIPDHVLLKPSQLTAEEYATIQRHPRIGHDVLSRAQRNSGIREDDSFLKYASQIALAHHEKWDGSGYPQGLKGDAIPLAARLMALADVYDALRSARHYKGALPHEEAVATIEEGRGAHFDPAVVDAFLAMQDAFIAIADRYTDRK